MHDITQSLPFCDNSFDVVFSNNTLYTISQKKRRKVFKEIYRVVKKEGMVVVCNLNDLFDPKKIYFAHIKESVTRYGLWKTVVDLFELVIPTINMFYYNYLIKKENTQGSYAFFKKEEQANSLKEVGFSLLGKTKSCYAGQAFFDIGIK